MSVRFTLTLIKVFLVVSIVALITTFYGLQNERKIEVINIEIENLKTANFTLVDWSMTFRGNYSEFATKLYDAKQKI